MLEYDSKLVKFLTEYKTLLNSYNANIKCPNYEKIAHKLGRSEYAILLIVINKYIYQKYKQDIDI